MDTAIGDYERKEQMMVSSRLTILAAGAAFALGAAGGNALGDDGPSFSDLDEIAVSDARPDDDKRDDGGGQDDRRIDGKRDEDDVDVEERDDEDDDLDTGNRDADSGGPRDAGDSGTAGGRDRTGGRYGGTGGDSREKPSVAPAPAPVPAPAYDGYSDDGGGVHYGRGSDYGDS